MADHGTDVSGAPEPDAYLIERVREALAHDQRVSELGISVQVAGERVLLRGEVATSERKAAATEIVAPLLGDRTLENGLTVATLGEAGDEEQIA